MGASFRCRLSMIQNWLKIFGGISNGILGVPFVSEQDGRVKDDEDSLHFPS